MDIALHQQLLDLARKGGSVEELFDALRSCGVNRGIREVRRALNELVDCKLLHVIGGNVRIFFSCGANLLKRTQNYLKKYAGHIENVLLEEADWISLRELRLKLSKSKEGVSSDSTLIEQALPYLKAVVELGWYKGRHMIRHIRSRPSEAKTAYVTDETAQMIQKAAQSCLERSVNKRFAFHDLKMAAQRCGVTLPEKDTVLNYLLASGMCVRITETRLPMFEAGDKLYCPAPPMSILAQDVSAAQQEAVDEHDWRHQKEMPVRITHSPAATPDQAKQVVQPQYCLLYTSPSPRD